MKENCLNCGHNAHNGPLIRTEKDENGRKYQIEICKHYRCTLPIKEKNYE